MYSWRQYDVATPVEKHLEIATIANRPSVLARWSDPEQASRWRDSPGSYLAALSQVESERLDVYNKLFPGEGFDVGQNPTRRPVFTKHGVLHTGTRGQWLVVDGRAGTWLHAVDIATSMGYPVTREHQEASGGVCSFSTGITPPDSRTYRSMRNQCGNAFHVNFIGAATTLPILKLAGLGMYVNPHATLSIAALLPALRPRLVPGLFAESDEKSGDEACEPTSLASSSSSSSAPSMPTGDRLMGQLAAPVKPSVSLPISTQPLLKRAASDCSSPCSSRFAASFNRQRAFCAQHSE